MNRYVYAYNNPVNLIDPSGHSPLETSHTWLDRLQTGFDIAGLVPVVGEFFDLTNAGIYYLRGDNLNAGLSALAIIPFAGWGSTGTKFGMKAFEGTGEATRRISGTHKELTSKGVKDSHHIIQDAAVRDLPGYDRNAARTVQLDGPSNRIGSEHYNAGQVQKQAGGGTYAAERRIGYRALRRAGVFRG